MALFNRMSRLLTADIHAVLDRLEAPEALLRQAIREMVEDLERDEQHLRQLEHEYEALQGRRSRIHASRAELDEQLDVCFDSGNETLARKLVKRKLEADRLDAHLAERLAAVDKARAARSSILRDRREQLDVMRQKAEVLTECAAPEQPFADEPSSCRLVVGDDEVEAAFLGERQRRSQR
jgi:phage shock protein A